MKFLTVGTYEELSRMAADIIADGIGKKPNYVLGLATGSTPVGTYKKLIEYNQSGKVDFQGVTAVNLDEYVGLDAQCEQSYRYFMNVNLFDHVNIDRSRTFVPDGCASDLAVECLEYDRRIVALGGIDLQLLGIGLDGHIGFNEPDEYFTAQTHEVVLDGSTVRANARFFPSEDRVPRTALTVGMGAIMQAKKILLIANGRAKKDILTEAFSGNITPHLPASVLQLHGDVTVIFSEE